MTDLEQLAAEWAELDAAATEGPWSHYGNLGHEVFSESTAMLDTDAPNVASAIGRLEDAELIVWMRNNVSTLIAELAATEESDHVEALVNARVLEANKSLGDIVTRLHQAALDATGMHDVIGENGDGDWQGVWENVADLGEKVRRLTAERDAAVDESERLANLHEQFKASVMDDYARIAAKQQRDADRIEELSSRAVE